MAINRPIGKNARLSAFKKETAEGVFVPPTQSHHFVSEGMKYTPQTIEDPSNVGQLFTSDMVKAGYGVEGSIEMKAHPYFIGDALFFALGKSDTPINPVQGFLIIWYTGSAKFSRIRKATTTITAETSVDGITWTADSAFGTAGIYTPGSAVLSAVATAINAFVGYKAKHVGFASAPIANLADWANVTMKANDVKTGACIQPYLVTSAIAKAHRIFADDVSLDDIPSFSMAIDRNFGVAKDIGLAGCKISSLGIKVAPRDMVDLSVGIKAKSQDNAYSYVASDVPADSRAFTTNLVQLFVDSMVTQETKELSIDINNNLYTDEAVGVDTFNAQGRQGASIEVSGSSNLTVTDATDEETISLQGKMQNDIPVEVIAYFEGSAFADLANNAKFSVLIRMRAIKLTDCSPVISGPDRLTLPITGKAVASAYGKHIDVWVTNKQTTAY
jgi:hypothetical protein